MVQDILVNIKYVDSNEQYVVVQLEDNDFRCIEWTEFNHPISEINRFIYKTNNKSSYYSLVKLDNRWTIYQQVNM